MSVFLPLRGASNRFRCGDLLSSYIGVAILSHEMAAWRLEIMIFSRAKRQFS